MKRIKIIFGCALLLLCQFAFAQETPLQVIGKMRKTYDDARSYSMHVTLRLFAKSQDASALVTAEGEVKVSGTNYYSSMLGKTTVVNDDYQLVTDEKQHVILVATAHHANKRDRANTLLDSSLYEGYQLKFLEQSPTLNRIEIIVNDPEAGYNSIQLHIDPSNYTLVKVEYYYKKGSPGMSTYEKTTISYSNIKLNDKIPDSAFDSDEFFTQKKGELVQTPAYATYRLIDQRDKNIPVIK